MEFFLQREIELRNFDKIRSMMVLHPSCQKEFLNNMVHIHQVVNMDNNIPNAVKQEIISGIEDILKDYRIEVLNQAEYFQSLEEETRINVLSDFTAIYHNYLSIKEDYALRYLTNDLSLCAYTECLVMIGEAERHLKPYMHNLGITNIDFS